MLSTKLFNKHMIFYTAIRIMRPLRRELLSTNIRHYTNCLLVVQLLLHAFHQIERDSGTSCWTLHITCCLQLTRSQLLCIDNVFAWHRLIWPLTWLCYTTRRHSLEIIKQQFTINNIKEIINLSRRRYLFVGKCLLKCIENCFVV